MRSRLRSIIHSIDPEQLELHALDLRKIAESNVVYALASTDVNHSAPNLIKMYVTIKSLMISIMVSIAQQQPELFALNYEKLLNLSLFTL